MRLLFGLVWIWCSLCDMAHVHCIHCAPQMMMAQIKSITITKIVYHFPIYCIYLVRLPFRLNHICVSLTYTYSNTYIRSNYLQDHQQRRIVCIERLNAQQWIYFQLIWTYLSTSKKSNHIQFHHNSIYPYGVHCTLYIARAFFNWYINHSNKFN